MLAEEWVDGTFLFLLPFFFLFLFFFCLFVRNVKSKWIGISLLMQRLEGVNQVQFLLLLFVCLFVCVPVSTCT